MLVNNLSHELSRYAGAARAGVVINKDGDNKKKENPPLGESWSNTIHFWMVNTIVQRITTDM